MCLWLHPQQTFHSWNAVQKYWYVKHVIWKCYILCEMWANCSWNSSVQMFTGLIKVVSVHCFSLFMIIGSTYLLSAPCFFSPQLWSTILLFRTFLCVITWEIAKLRQCAVHNNVLYHTIMLHLTAIVAFWFVKDYEYKPEQTYIHPPTTFIEHILCRTNTYHLL